MFKKKKTYLIKIDLHWSMLPKYTCSNTTLKCLKFTLYSMHARIKRVRGDQCGMNPNALKIKLV